MQALGVINLQISVLCIGRAGTTNTIERHLLGKRTNFAKIAHGQTYNYICAPKIFILGNLTVPQDFRNPLACFAVAIGVDCILQALEVTDKISNHCLVFHSVSAALQHTETASIAAKANSLLRRQSHNCLIVLATLRKRQM